VFANRRCWFPFDIIQRILDCITNEGVTLDAPLFEHIAIGDPATGEFGGVVLSDGSMLRVIATVADQSYVRIVY